MKKCLRKLIAVGMSIALMAGMCVTASAFTYPSSYWPLHNQWPAVSAGSDAGAIVSLAQKIYDELIPLGMSWDVCGNLETKCAKASWACEVKGDINGAITWLERQLNMAKWLNSNGYGYEDTLLDGNARMAYLQAAKTPKIYAQSDTDPSPYGYGPTSGTWFGSALGYDQPGESAALMYVDFQDGYSVEYWIDYYMNTSENFNKAAHGGVIELAWNFHPEGTAGAQAVLSADSYISEGVRAMGELDATVLLRVGAEMNNWVECDANTYIQAFRKIADAAAAYDNIQMVFSPGDISNRNVSIAQYYPGDQYVDWVGMSTYHNSNYNDVYGNPQSYSLSGTPGSNPYYGNGLYDYDPMVIIKPIVDLAKSHNKPVMISECGFGYLNTTTGIDQTAYASDQLNKFYSYVNMVYPQVKAVFYFDVNLSGSKYNYALNGNSTMLTTYRNAIANNGAYLAEGQTSTVGWEELSQTSLDQAGTLKLASYVSFPGVKNATVQYYVDGKLTATVSQAPYYFNLNTAALGAGTHKIHVVASGGQFKQQSASYTLTVPGSSKPVEQTPSSWAEALIVDAQSKGLITERTKGVYQDQITRLQFAELAVNMIEKATGKAIAPAQDNFKDTDDVMALKAVAAGVASGKGEGVFAPSAPITRQEICVMLNKAVQYVDQTNGTKTLDDSNTVISKESFKDADTIDSWATESVALLVNNGLMAGQNGGVAPKANTTVEQAIVLIRALYDKF